MNELRLHDADRRNGSEPTESAGLESLLRTITCDMVDEVDAPPFDDVRRAIGHRARSLRRRRHARRVAAGGILAAAAAIAVVTLHPVRPDVQVGPAGGGAGGPAAAIALDLDGWTLERAEEHHDVADLTDAVLVTTDTPVQLFRVRDRLDGPVVHLVEVFATDTVGQTGGGRPVDVGGAPGYLVEESDSVSLRWNPGGDDSEARLTAFGLDGDEVLAFARALDRRDTGDDADSAGEQAGGSPRSVVSEELTGFVATAFPRGIEEVDLPARRADPVNVRRLWFAGPGDGERPSVEIQVDDRGEWAFELDLYDPDDLAVWNAPEQVAVLGRPALLRHDAARGRWLLQWRHAEDAWVTVTVGGGDDVVDVDVDRATVDRIIEHLDELSEPSWQDALAAAPPG